MERDLPLNVMFRTEDIWPETRKFGRQVVMRLRDLEGKTEIAFATTVCLLEFGRVSSQ